MVKTKKKTAYKTDNDTEEMKKTSSRGGTRKKEELPPPEEPPKKDPDPSSVGNQLAMILLIVMSVFIGVCYAFRDDVGVIGYAIDWVCFGFFGLAAFLVPFMLLQIALFWRRDVVSGAVKYKYLVAIFVLLFSSVMVHTIYGLASDVTKLDVQASFSWEGIKGFFTDGMQCRGGGLFGGILSSAMICAVGYPGTILFAVLFLIGFVMALFGLTPIECIQRYRFYSLRSKQAQKARAEAKKEARAEREQQEKEDHVKTETQASASTAKRSRSENVKKTAATHARRTENIDRDIFTDDAEFGAETEKTDLRKVFDKEEDETLLTRYAAELPIEEETDALAEIKLTSEEAPRQGTSYMPIEELTEDIEPQLPVKKTPSKQKEEARSAVTAERTPAYEPIRRKPSAEKAEHKAEPKAESAPIIVQPPKVVTVSEPSAESAVSDVIAIRPPEMSVPAPDTEADEETVDIPKPREYEFPPIDLLSKPPRNKAEGDVSAELRENADRIIRALDSFNVRVSISNVSRGPTITRYEVEPAPGTRVRSIINLLDDIALSLATSGVRSDGIISGKSAIGIEVPNKKTNTVYVRELIEDNRFESAKSKLTASLGMDVSGAPVYLDIAKMPHLLIAGATGQGKSVCINSLIISLLYKARPDEVKLILIDPKKVELNVYNGLPHLLVPVVFDPKKAAGSLHWAVQEMERRFELIEAQHVRNIAQYNAAIADDPLKEKLPQVVIIIDELADLMMSAPDDVETSICRLAQKARAAGMHLIIGTQRPSTDVITGLIKANIPSRIAFTVSNQIDSRIIIDTQGAEKLIGKGDMLFSPVGSSKPIRVQGSFVSETEIESIIDFIKSQSTEVAYSDDVIKEIEKNAAVCGQKKTKAMGTGAEDGGLDDGEEVDPMLNAAIELAVESGKISTSLIQRRLSLGYGRAAKLIDVMEKRGIVSPPEGQKPRTVLISREQFLEMKMNQNDSAADDGGLPFDL